jgi:hypothetical protein
MLLLFSFVLVAQLTDKHDKLVLWGHFNPCRIFVGMVVRYSSFRSIYPCQD